MRILQVHNLYREPGGEDAVVRAEAELLDRAGHQVAQHTQQNPSGSWSSARALATASWNPLQARALQAVVDRFRPDVAHVHNTWYAMSPAVVVALHRCDVPVVMTLHNFRLVCANAMLYRDGEPCEDCLGTHPWHGVQHRCYRNSAVASAAAAAAIAIHQAMDTWNTHVQRFLVPNEFARRKLLLGGLRADKVKVKPNFVPDPGPRPTPPSASDAFVYVGRISENKGVESLVDAAGCLESLACRIDIIGDGPLVDRLSRRAPSCVRFLGRRTPADVRVQLLRARALLFPSRSYEVQPMTVLEAAAAGLPVVASALGGNEELLRTLTNDWLVEPDDTEAWSQVLQRLAVDSGAELDVGGTELRTVYERDFSEAAGLQNLMQTYEEVTGVKT